jgi:hypothetical protein
MLGVALTAQRAGWGSGPLEIILRTTSAVTYETYQTPAFSWINNTDYSSQSQFNWWNNGNIDTQGYTSLTGYNNKNSTSFITFKLNMPEGLTSNEGIKIDTKFNGGGADFTTNWAWVCGYTTPAPLQINVPTGAGIALPGTDYQAYNDRWLTVVACSSDTSANFSDWSTTSPQGDWYFRTAIFDTETGELITKGDLRGQQPMGWPFDLADWMTVLSPDRVSTNRLDDYSYSYGGLTDSQPNIDLAVTNYWVAMGTMFDPLSVADTSWRTIRPSAQIGNAVAWFNGQMCEYGNDAGYTNAWVTPSGMDLWTPETAGRQMVLIRDNSGNATIFNAKYSTDIPKNTG